MLYICKADYQAKVLYSGSSGKEERISPRLKPLVAIAGRLAHPLHVYKSGARKRVVTAGADRR